MAGRSSRTRPVKQLLLLLIAIGGLAAITVPGVWALFSADTRNTQQSATSGTLTFSNKVGTGSLCFSYGGSPAPGNVNACTALFTYTAGAENYPNVPVFANVTIANNGSLDASDLSLYMPGGCAPASTPLAPAPGSGNPCSTGGLQMYVQEMQSDFTTVIKCRYPAAAGACSFNSNTLNTFATNGTSVATALDLGAGPATGAARYFKIGLQLPSTASNTLQGREAVFSLTWHMTS
jgi:hypothetical protein